MKLKYVKTIKIKVKLLTGLHIGSGNEQIEIGGVDNPVVKTKNGYPYIPGSSLKGKLRSLYEIKTGKISKKSGKDGEYGDVYHLTKEDFEKDNKEALFICKVFGTVLDKDFENKTKKSDVLSKIGPTRAIFRDLYITEESKKKLEEYKEKTGNMLENKAEVALARYGFKTGGLRNIERVPAGIEFEGEIKLRVFENDDENFLLQELKNLLEEDLTNDYLGGGGSRGNGQVEVEVKVI